MSSNRSCGVSGCTNTYSKTNLKRKLVSYYAFPKQPWLKERRQVWIAFARRKPNKDGTPWQPTKNAVICSEHFVSGEKSEDPRKVNYNPTILVPGKSSSPTGKSFGISGGSPNESDDDDDGYSDVNNDFTTDIDFSVESPINHVACMICSSQWKTTQSQNSFNPSCIKFCTQILESNQEAQRFLKLFESFDNLSICTSCETLINAFATKDGEIVKVERKVTELQQLLMKALCELQARVKEFYEVMRKIGNLVKTNDIKDMLHQSTVTESSDVILNFRKQVICHVRKLQKFDHEMERKIHCEVEQTESNFDDLEEATGADGEEEEEVILLEIEDDEAISNNREEADEQQETSNKMTPSQAMSAEKDLEHRSRTPNNEKREEKVKQFFCDKCDKGFVAEFTLECHQWWNHMSKEEQKESIRNGVGDPWTVKYKNSRRSVSGPQICLKCGKAFDFPYALKEHEKIHEKVRERIMCSTCGKQVLKENFNCHQKKCEFGETASGIRSAKRVECDICGKSFKCASYLNVHKQKHSGDKPFLCAICPKAFTVWDLLRKHEVVHSDERPFVCRKGCGGGFKNQRNRKRHEQSCNGNGTPVRKKAKQVAPPTNHGSLTK